MAASGKRPRKARYAPDAPGVLTSRVLDLVEQVTQLWWARAADIVTVSGLSVQAVQRDLRVAFDHRLLDIIAVAPAVLQASNRATTPTISGSSPNIYTPRRAALTALKHGGRDTTGLRLPDRVPHPLLWRHELAVTETLAWLLACARIAGHQVVVRRGPAAAIPYGMAATAERGILRPDGLAIYRFGNKTLAAALEIDRETERAPATWIAKLARFEQALGTPAFQDATGFGYGRVLVLTRSERRRDALAELIERTGPAWLAERIFLATTTACADADLRQARWRRPGQTGYHPVLPPE